MITMPKQEPFDPAHPEHDLVGTIRQARGQIAGTWICEPYWPGDAEELSTRWRCLDSPDRLRLGDTKSHRWLVDEPVVGAAAGTPAYSLWQRREPFVGSIQVFTPMPVTDESFTFEQLAVVRNIARLDGRVKAVKAVRDFIRCGLKEGITYVDALIEQQERDARNLAEAGEL